MEKINNKVKQQLKQLFNEAKNKVALDYIYTLVRVKGITCNTLDPLINLKSLLRDLGHTTDDEGISSLYLTLLNYTEPFDVLANLINCISGKPYHLSPFSHLNKGQFPNIVRPKPIEIALEFVRIANELSYTEIAGIIENAYKNSEKQKFENSKSSEYSQIESALINYKTFLESFLEKYDAEIFEYKKHPRFYKLPRFNVLEVLVNEDVGLYGFKMHFSNGSHALFARYKDSTENINIATRVPLEFFVGNLDDLKDGWKVGDKHLYEIGIPGRYNKIGEWHPLFFPGKYDHLEKEARSLSNDPDVQGQYFFMLCTGYRVIEFAVVMNIELPTEISVIGERIFLQKFPQSDQEENSDQNICIYDGWVELESTEPDYIKSAIEIIGIVVNRIAFTYGVSARWSLKYGHNLNPRSRAKPAEEDLKIIDTLLKKFPNDTDGIIIDAAIDWYNRGKSANNIFTSFLCYYIALESVAIAVDEGRADFKLGYTNVPKNERKKRRIDCIENLHKSIYSKDAAKFVRDAYFECIVSLKEKTKKVLQLVFGEDHQYLKIIFERHGDYSLSEIRSKLAHGEFTLLNQEERDLVRNSLYHMAKISEEFIKRIIFSLKPEDQLPNWSQLHDVKLSFSDPRTIKVTTHENIFPNKDWKIKAEWVE